jgi:methionine-rich copper-binding protein CopC
VLIKALFAVSLPQILRKQDYRGTQMIKLFTLLVVTVLMIGTSANAQERAQHPISSAKIVGMDGRIELVFEEPISEAFTISVMDLTGKSIFTQTHQHSAEPCQFVEIPVENLKRGIYMVRVMGDDGKTKTLKLQRN